MSLTTIATAIAFAIGILSGYSIERAQVLLMEKAIVEQKLEAAEKLKSLTDIANKEILANIETNALVDSKAREYNDELNTLNTSLNALRLRKPACRKSSGSAGTKSNSTGDTKSETYSAGVPERLHEFLTTRTLYSDRNSAYALECYNFVIERNCGIATGEK